jgi:hypothetical protein
MRERACAVGLVVTLALGAVTGQAHAVGRLLVPADASAKLVRVRVAMADAPARTTMWMSALVGGAAPKIAWVVPVAPGTLADRASGRWMTALDDATAPRVFPPNTTLGCGDPGFFENTAQPPTAGELPVASAEILGSLDEVAGYALRSGLAFGPEDRTVLDAHGTRFLGFLFSNPGAGVWTEPVRLTYPEAQRSLALDLLRGSSPAPLTVFVVGDQGHSASGLLQVPADRMTITWSFLDKQSDYLSVRAETLASHRGGLAVNEYSGPAALFDWTLLPDGAGFVAPAAVSYLENELGSAEVERLGCVDKIAGFAVQTERASLPCAPGGLARVPQANGTDPACSESAGFDAHRLACGSASELAHALGGMSPDAVLTRIELLVADSTPSEVELVANATPERGCALRASRLVGGDCPAPVVGTGGASSGGAPVGQQGSGGSAEGTETTTNDPGPGTVVVVDSGCSSSSSSPPPDDTTQDGCSCGSGTSSDSSDSSGDGCGSGGGDGCGSGGSDGYSGDTCGSSGGGSGYSGDTCSGGGSDCSLGRPRHRRVRLSAWVVVSAMILWPLRRRSRAKCRLASTHSRPQ